LSPKYQKWQPYLLRESFQQLARDIGLKQGENIIFAGCPGGCYSWATLFGFYLKGFGANSFFAPNAERRKIRRLIPNEDLGLIAGRKASPGKARMIVLLSGLCRYPIEPALELVNDLLQKGGILIGQSNNPGIYETEGWTRKLRFDYFIEYKIKDVEVRKVKK